MPLSAPDLHALIDWLGDVGASAGLERSHLTVGELRQLAIEINAKLPSKSNRKDLVGAIISKASQRIDLSVQELLAMDSNDLLGYFEKVRPSKAELLAVLNELDFHPGSEAQKGLYKYAARQIAETGMFQRVATNEDPSKGSAN